jgi:myo-inositol 2-dehydrogenase / D-chiro-inositol 1-dehydrogenase
MTPLRIAVLGFAHHHAHFWAEAITAHPGAMLCGVWDDDVPRGIEAAARFRTMFRADMRHAVARADAVCVTTETTGHEAAIAAAAEAGKPILCEKPLAASLDQARRIAEVVARSAVFFMQSLPKRLDPVNHALREAIASGELGEIRLARVRHGHSHGLDPAFTAGWWTDPARSGGGTLLDEGVHAADLLRWLFGDPVDVTAMLSQPVGLQVETAAIAVFRWADGMLGEIAAGWTMAAAEASIEIFGTKGTAIVSGVDLASRGKEAEPGLRICATDGERFVRRGRAPRFAKGGFHQAVATAFIDALIAGRPPPITLADGMGAQAMIDAAYRAARSGRTAQVVP